MDTKIKNKIMLISAIIIAAVLYWCGWVSYKYTHEPEIKTITVTNIQEKIVYRDYPSMTNDELIKKLKCYDTTPFHFNYKTLDVKSDSILIQNIYSLCDRVGSHDLLVPINTSGNWKLYVGAGVVVGTLVTAGIVYLVK